MLVNKDRIYHLNVKNILKTRKMTSEHLRSFKGFESITEDEAAQTILMLEQFCKMVCKHVTSPNIKQQ